MASLTIEPQAEPQVEPVIVGLEANDTCDKCGPGVKALVAVQLRTGKLVFCKHCYTRFEAALAPLILGMFEKLVG